MKTGNDLVAEPLQYSSDFGHSFKMKISEISLYFNGLRFHLSILPKSNYLPLCCFTGLAYIDCKLLRKEYVVEDEQGNKWIDTKRFKTGINCKIPLLPVSEHILEKYDYTLPVISNQKMNGYLKELGDICGIKKDLHTHVARHTAATLFLNNNVELNSVSKILGHTNIKMTQRYAKLLDTTILKQMDVMKTKFAV